MHCSPNSPSSSHPGRPHRVAAHLHHTHTQASTNFLIRRVPAGSRQILRASGSEAAAGKESIGPPALNLHCPVPSRPLPAPPHRIDKIRVLQHATRGTKYVIGDDWMNHAARTCFATASSRPTDQASMRRRTDDPRLTCLDDNRMSSSSLLFYSAPWTGKLLLGSRSHFTSLPISYVSAGQEAMK